MTQNKKVAIFLLSGAAVLAYYRYKSLSRQRKQELQLRATETAKQLFGPFIPDSIRDRLAKQDSIDNDPEYGKSYF